ncbi:hypothetical protein M3Y97_00189500 [Aphelenchoides bicaudatus]|nr:hypothetical protein M3Y97_00189500 [Aphelenchoides bicaudatus]
MLNLSNQNCFCNLHVHKAVVLIFVFGLVSNIVLIIGNMLTRQNGYSSLCFFSIICYLFLVSASRTGHLGLYWPFFVVQPALLLSFIFTSFLMLIGGIRMFRSISDTETNSTNYFLADINRLKSDAIGFVVLAAFYLVFSIPQYYFVYVAAKDFVHVKQNIGKPRRRVATSS